MSEQLGLFDAPAIESTPFDSAWWRQQPGGTEGAWRARTEREYDREFATPTARCEGCGLPVPTCTRHQRRFRAGEKVYPDTEKTGERCPRRDAP